MANTKIKVDRYPACVDISKTGRYLVRSNNSKIRLIDFKTKEVIKEVKKRCYITRDISDDDRYCVFTSNGERRLNVLSLPDLEEIASIDTNYVRDVNFASDNTVLFFERGSGEKNSCLKKWELKRNSVSTIFSADTSDYRCTSAFYHNGFFLAIYANDCSTNGKFRIISEDYFKEYTIEDCEPGYFYDFKACSQILNSKILISKKSRSNIDKREIGIYNFNDKSYTPIVKKKAFHLFWLTEDLFWYSDTSIGGIMNLKGEVLHSIDFGPEAVPCSNKDYFLFFNAFGTYVLKKTGLNLLERA